MHGDHVHVVERPSRLQPLHEGRIDRRHAAKHTHEAGILGGDGLAGQAGHAREDIPLGIQFGVPVRLVVRLVPDLHRLDHDLPPPFRG